MFRKSALYGLADMEVGATRAFTGLSPQELGRIRRSAHNYNTRTGMYFTTKLKDAVLYVTRLR